MHAFVISYVRTVLRVLSKYSLACWFGQMLTKAISWMKSMIASPMPRGVPVSPARSRILVTCIVYASATRNKSPRASLRRSKSCSFQESYHPLRGDIFHHRCYRELVVMPPYPPSCFSGVHVINCWAVSAQPCIIFSTPGIFLLWPRYCLPVRRNSSLLVR